MAATTADPLAADLASIEVQHGAVQGFWRIESRSGEQVFVVLTAPDARTYTMELDCSGYGLEPIAGRFVDPKSRTSDASAWPRGDPRLAQWLKWEPAHLFICWDQDRAGVAHHPEWRARRAWARTKNQFYAYLDFIRQLLHVPERGYSRTA